MREYGMSTGIAALTLMLTAAPAKAETWIVDNNPTHSADFQSLQEAIDNAEAGDTIYVAGSTEGYGDRYGRITVKKELHLVGQGYFLNENFDNLATVPSADLGRVKLTAEVDEFGRLISSSAGSSLTGLHLHKSIDVRVPNTMIKRCYLNGAGISLQTFRKKFLAYALSTPSGMADHQKLRAPMF